jgi:hypothetical protein
MSKNIFAIILLIYAVFGNGLLDFIDKTIPSKPNPSIAILNIEKPKQEVINRLNVFSKLITDPTDRAKIALFNYEFAKRISSYETDVQQINDVYSLAGKIFFQTSLVNKYDGLADNIISLLEEILTDENHIVTKEEKMKLNEYFSGIAWVLTNNKIIVEK